MNSVNSQHVLWPYTSSRLQKPRGHVTGTHSTGMRIGTPTILHFPHLPPLLSQFQEIRRALWARMSLSFSIAWAWPRTSSWEGLFLSCSVHLWAPAAFDAQETPCNSIRSSLQGACNYVLSGPCNDSPLPLCPAQLPRTFRWEGTNLLSPAWMQFCIALPRRPQKWVPTKQKGPPWGTVRVYSVLLCSLPWAPLPRIVWVGGWGNGWVGHWANFILVKCLEPQSVPWPFWGLEGRWKAIEGICLFSTLAYGERVLDGLSYPAFYLDNSNVLWSGRQAAVLSYGGSCLSSLLDFLGPFGLNFCEMF